MPHAISRRFLLGAVLALVTAGSALAAESRFFATGDGAIRGYDPVAYFDQGEPVKGSPQHSFEWKGVTWRFASAEHRERFMADPEKYAPKYGGYCAWAVSQGYTASTVPEAWKIVDGALYLNYSKGVQSRWEKDIPGNIAAAEGHWPKIEAELSE